ncbi:MAG: hypothetical protein KW788_01435 [Candidatus Doudnabacteria bacterium]|nr:hypothetical protein [Candidatus Doudnabacteria bacterium]
MSLQTPLELKGIRVNKKTSELIFELDEGGEVVVAVSQDTDKFYFRLGGGQYATIDKAQILGKIH